MIKLYSNSDNSIFANYDTKNNIMYFSSGVGRHISERTDAAALDIYIDPEEGYLLFDICHGGEYSKAPHGKLGFKVCLRAAKGYQIDAGRHDVAFIDDPDSVKLKVDFRGCKRA